MNVAVIYTGAMRSFDKCLENQRWHVLRNFPGASFYIVTEEDEDAKKAELLREKYPGAVEIRYVKQPQMVIPNGCPDEWTPGRPYTHEPYHISVHPHAVLGQLWMLNEGWKFYQSFHDKADLVIRIRPDLWFHSFEKPRWFCESTNAYADGLDGIACTPWWGRFGGCNDRFALLGSKAAEAYFTAYATIQKMIDEGAPLHQETLIHYAMKRAGISICDDMKAEFSTLRKTGEMRPPEITMIDLAHAGMNR